MKPKLFFLILMLLISTLCIAQQGINYKALIKDNLGNVIANDLVQVQFTILQGAAQTNVYQETQSPTTDTNGLIVVNIGEGTVVSGNFNTIEWANDEHYLNVQINTGAGLVDLGTTQFMSVPYAKHAEIAGNVNGLETIDEGNGFGWRLIGRNPAEYGSIGYFATDLSYSMHNSEIFGATGAVSTAFGYETTASGAGSFAAGGATKAEAAYSTAFGTANIGGGNPLEIVQTDPLFEIGNGEDLESPSNALTILKNGTITAPSFDIAEITDDKALVTKEYLEANQVLKAINQGNGIGWRLAFYNQNNYGTIGSGAVDLSLSGTPSTTRGARGNGSVAMGLNVEAFGTSSTAIGKSVKALGLYSLAMGNETEASGNNSTAMGRLTKASGFASTAMGVSTEASGNSSTVMGRNTTASADYSTAIGYQTYARSFAETAIGYYNTDYTPLFSNGVDPNDRLFSIGNGVSSFNRNNALTVLKNGKIGINKASNINGRLDIDHNSTLTQPHISLRETQSDYARLNFSNSVNRTSEYWAIAGYIGPTQNADRLNFFNSDQGDIMSIHGNGNVYVNGSLAHSSDKRLKKDIETLSYGLQEVLQLQPVAYNWKNRDTKHKSLGLLAQDVQNIITNVVLENNDEAKTLSISYTELIPVLIKAIQEQQEIIANQKLIINQAQQKNIIQDKKIKQQDINYEVLLQRIEALEANR